MSSARSSVSKPSSKANLFSNPDLDREKFGLERLKHKHSAALAEVEQQLEWVAKRTQEKKDRMSAYESTFLVGGRVKQVRPDGPEALGKTGRTARFGRKDAVLGTKKILNKHLRQLETQVAVMEKKLNTTQSNNASTREEINSLRKGQLVYVNLFEKLQVELSTIKNEIQETQTSIDQTYQERTAVRKEVQNLMDQVQGLQLESQLEWQVQDRALAEAETIMQNPARVPDHADVSGGLSAQQEQELRDQQSEALAQIAQDQLVVEKIESRVAEYEAALEAVRDGTGFDDMDVLIQTLQSFNAEKFSKVEAVNMLISDIESQERGIQTLKDRYLLNEEHYNSVAQVRRKEVLSLEDEASNLEAAVEETEHDIKSMLGDIAVLRQPLHDLFTVLGCSDLFEATEALSAKASLEEADSKQDESKSRADTPLEAPASPKSAADGVLISPSARSPSSPSLSSNRMYMRSPLLKQSMQAGLSLSNLQQFVSILGQKATETLHRYAVVMAAQTESGAEAVAQLAALAAVQSGAPEAQDVMKIANANAKTAHKSLAKAGVHMGPEAPPGAQMQTLTRSALLAALVDTDSAAKAAGTDVDSHPLTRAELQATASRTLKSSSLQAAVQASTKAASYLSKHTQVAPSKAARRAE